MRNAHKMNPTKYGQPAKAGVLVSCGILISQYDKIVYNIQKIFLRFIINREGCLKKPMYILNLEPWIRPKQKRTQNYVPSYEYESIFEIRG